MYLCITDRLTISTVQNILLKRWQTQLDKKFHTEICALLGFYTALIGNLLLMLQDSLSVPS